jgi:membrane associated rhomboid family serine protease
MPYSRSSSPFEQVGDFLRRSQTPATFALIAVCAVLFLADFFTRGALAGTGYFTFFAPIILPQQIISLFAYPFLNQSFISLAFASLWLYGIGGSLERSWGSVKYLFFFIAVTAASGLGLEFGCLLLHQGADLRGGLWLPVTSVTVAWATLNPYVSVMAYGLVPIQARWIAVFEVGVIYFVYYQGLAILGLFVLTGSLLAFLVVRLGWMNGSGYSGGPGPDLRIVSGGHRRRPLDDVGSSLSFNPIDKIKAWQQRRKLAKLLQKSGFTDRDDNERKR